MHGLRLQTALSLSALVLGAGLIGGLAGCVGDIGDSGDSKDPNEVVPTKDSVAVSGLRRLTAYEYQNGLRDLLADDTSPQTLLPEDVRKPFDNDYMTQVPSEALIAGLELLARDVVAKLLADPPRRDAVVGCTPTGPDDAECFEQFIARFGRKALRRPLTAEELQHFGTFLQFGIDGNDFYSAVQTALLTFLQHPELVYRVEVGSAVYGQPDLFRLNDFEVAARLSYFIWETTPDDWLLDRVEEGKLASQADIKATATEMLLDPRSREAVNRFHAMWLGFENLASAGALAPAMRVETSALIDRVVFDELRPWQDLFRIEETFVSDELADHYGLERPGSTPKWVSYAGTKRKGLLSHGSFLSNGAKFADTSPTMRGLAIRTRLMCQTIPPPPPGVDVDNPPGDPDGCKEERYRQHAAGGCAGCHSLMDPVGFGLENFDANGAYRETEPGKPDCAIKGVGKLEGVGTFSGPAELGDLLLKSGMNGCVMQQVYRFAVGRTVLTDEDLLTVKAMTERAGGETADFRFDEALLGFVASDSFRYRRQEEAP